MGLRKTWRMLPAYLIEGIVSHRRIYMLLLDCFCRYILVTSMHSPWRRNAPGRTRSIVQKFAKDLRKGKQLQTTRYRARSAAGFLFNNSFRQMITQFLSKAIYGSSLLRKRFEKTADVISTPQPNFRHHMI